jgi:SAM-dependent methyltransferase
MPNNKKEEYIDTRVNWKNLIRRHQKIASIFEFIFNPAFISDKKRSQLIKDISRYGRILNIGSGAKDFGEKCINLDVEPFDNVDIVGDGRSMPFSDQVFDLVILEYVLEHILDTSRLISEIHRVLKIGGIVYVTVPFMQGYHGNPRDYYRFTVEGINELWNRFKFIKIACEPSGGPTSALICMIKEYLAILFSFNNKTLYSILSQLFIIPFFPFKYLDLILSKNINAHNISYSILYIGKKQA